MRCSLSKRLGVFFFFSSRPSFYYKHQPTHSRKLERRKKRRKSLKNKRQTKDSETNEKLIHNLSSLLSRDLKFIQRLRQTKQQLLRQDFEQFARRMRLLYIFPPKTREPHPFHVKSTWMHQVQHSVARESY